MEATQRAYYNRIGAEYEAHCDTDLAGVSDPVIEQPLLGSLPDWFRRRWYRRDRRFAANEAAIDLAALKARYADRFDFAKEYYCGNLWFLLVYNSMILNIPLRLKPLYTPALLRLEAMIARFQGERLACVVICQWQKR